MTIKLMDYSKFKDISTIILDVDGVLTDGNVLINELGEELRMMNIKDGYAIREAIKNNFLLVVISGGNSKGVYKRLTRLGVTEVFINVKNKLKICEKILKKHDLESKNVLYMGDDLPDFEVMKLAGLKCCPKDAVPEIIEISDYICEKTGGKGCVREVISKLLKLKEEK